MKNWCFWTVVLEKTLESPLECKKIQPVHPKGNQSWIFIGRTDAEAETPIFWPPDAKSRLIGKDPDAGKDWGQEEEETTEDEMVGWHHRLNGHGFGWTLGVGDGQGGLACCGSWGRKESDTTEWLNWTELKWTHAECILFFKKKSLVLFFSIMFEMHWYWCSSSISWFSFPGGANGQEPGNAGDIRDVGSVPGLGRSPGGGHGNTPVVFPEESHRRRSLVGYRPWDHKQPDTTEVS